MNTIMQSREEKNCVQSRIDKRKIDKKKMVLFLHCESKLRGLYAPVQRDENN